MLHNFRVFENSAKRSVSLRFLMDFLGPLEQKSVDYVLTTRQLVLRDERRSNLSHLGFWMESSNMHCKSIHSVFRSRLRKLTEPLAGKFSTLDRKSVV